MFYSKEQKTVVNFIIIQSTLWKIKLIKFDKAFSFMNNNGLFGEIGQNNHHIVRMTSLLNFVEDPFWTLLPFQFVYLSFILFISFFPCLFTFQTFFFHFLTLPLIPTYSLSLHYFISKYDFKLSFFKFDLQKNSIDVTFSFIMIIWIIL